MSLPNLERIRSKMSKHTHARVVNTRARPRVCGAWKLKVCAQNKYIAHATCHDPYNVPTKFGEDKLRNVETHSQTHTQTHTHTEIPKFIVRLIEI
jgi:hypothetical protein